MISYQLGWDKQGRPRAENVLFRELPAAKPEPAPRGLLPASVFAAAFIAAVVALSVLGKVPWLAIPIYVAASLLSFCVYAFDKSAAMNRRRRTREQTLHVLSLAGGWPGALIAQRLFHHKSKKLSFQAVFWLIVALHVAAAMGLATGFLSLGALGL